jgi:ABC-type antimicrobial peptide transport system permease subunit
LTEAGRTPPVAIVNDEFARQIVGTADAVGRRFRSYRGTLVTIVGVVETGKYSTYAEAPKPVVFWPILQRQDTETLLLVRSSRPEAVVAAEMARVVKALDPALPIYGSGSLISLTQLAFLPGWIASIAMGAFGMLAVMLAVTGIYGLASYSVSRRVREIGIRMAIGARPAQVLRAVMGRLALLVAGGSIAGISLGIASSQLLSVVVYQASPRDPVTLAAVGAIMSAIAVLSALGPIRRAISIEPVHALREG